MNILAIGAHPGDVEIMCAGTLLKYREQGHSIFLALTTSGNAGSDDYSSREETAQVREQEQLDAAGRYGAAVRFLRFDEGAVYDCAQLRRAMLTAIRWANPDVILTHAPWDADADRGTTGRMVTQVLLSVGGKQHPADLPPIEKAPQVFFCDTFAGLGFLPEVYVDISAQMPEKQAVLKLFRSQQSRLKKRGVEDLGELCGDLARYRGFQAACGCAEAFVAHKMYAFPADPRVLP